MPALEQVIGAIRALQTSTMVLLAKIFSNVNLKTSTVLAKRLILDAWLGPGRASADWYITALKIQTKICKVRRQVKVESFQSTISIWSLSDRPTINTTIKSICSVPWPIIFARETFCKLSSKLLRQRLFLVKPGAFSKFFWTPFRRIVFWGASYFRR